MMDAYHIHGLLIIITIALTLNVMRFLPFIVFRNNVPKTILYLGKVLPQAVMGMLVVYCLKVMTCDRAGLILCVACIITILVHKLKHMTLLSILAGTLFYVIFMNFISG